MTKEALKLALEALEDLGMKHYESTGEVLYKETFTAIKEALANEALEKMAETTYNESIKEVWFSGRNVTGLLSFDQYKDLEIEAAMRFQHHKLNYKTEDV